MSRTLGTVVRGVRAPIIREGDDLAAIVTKSVLDCAAAEGAAFRDRDVVSVTEAIVARAQGNYATPDDIAADVRAKFGDHTVGVVFPILSRNRFSLLPNAGADDSSLYVAEFHECDWDCGLDEAGVIANFSLIKTDWSAGR